MFAKGPGGRHETAIHHLSSLLSQEREKSAVMAGILNEAISIVRDYRDNIVLDNSRLQRDGNENLVPIPGTLDPEVASLVVRLNDVIGCAEEALNV